MRWREILLPAAAVVATWFLCGWPCGTVVFLACVLAHPMPEKRA